MKIIVLVKKKIVQILFICFLIFLVLFSSSNFTAAKNGLKLWANNVVPALFPFFVAIELLKYTNLVYFFSKRLNKFMMPLFNVSGVSAFPFVMGLISGYPVGAKIVSNLYEENAFSKDEAERTLAFTNNSGPLFIIGTVGTAFYANTTIGVTLLFTHILASISIGLLFGAISKRHNVYNSIIQTRSTSRNNSTFDTNNTSYNFEKLKVNDVSIADLGNILSLSILSAIKTILMIGGFVVTFSVIISILKKTGILILIANFISSVFSVNQDIVLGTLTGILEFTNGVSAISQVHLKNISTNIIISAFIIGFGGFSVVMQVLGIVAKNKLSIKKYLLGKFLQGLIAAFYTFLILQIPIFSFNL